MPAPGLNYRLSDILCAVGLPQIRRLDELLAARTRIADGYTERLRDLPVALPRAADGDVHGWQAYVIQVDDRDRVLRSCAHRGSRRRSARTRCSCSAPTATRARSRARRASSSGRSRCPFHTRLTDGRSRPGRGGT